MTRTWVSLLACLLLMACTGAGGGLPSSGGRLYEVLLVGDREELVRQMLEADAEGLPQGEPSFDVSAVDSAKFNASVRQARSIVMVLVDPNVYSKAHVGYEKNVWAKPQIVVRIGVPSVDVLRRSAPSIGTAVRTLLNRAEANKNLALLRHKRNTKAEQIIRQMFGVSIWIPADMVASKRGKDFIWLSNNAPTTMQNIVLYKAVPALEKPSTPAVSVGDDLRWFVAQRNMALRQNIKGETDSMWMTTVAPTVSKALVFRNNRDRMLWLRQKEAECVPITLFRGLWEMHGDDMGGPFVSRCLSVPRPTSGHGEDGKSVVAEGFVFAPGCEKRNAIRRLETVLYTLQWDRQ